MRAQNTVSLQKTQFKQSIINRAANTNSFSLSSGVRGQTELKGAGVGLDALLG